MMKVIGEEGTTTQDFILYMKSEFLDSVYFQQNSFDEVDAAVDVERQTYTFNKVVKILASEFDLGNKDDARAFFNQLRQKFIDWNYSEWNGDKFKSNEKDIDELYASKNGKVSSQVAQMLKDGE
jgi:V/A-type H+-transporting ATPase subunit A